MTTKKTNEPANNEMALFIADCMLERKALNVKVLDVTEITAMTDYFVICSSESEPQTKAILDNIRDGLRDEGVKPWHVEGEQQLKWVLMDYASVIVHIFYKDVRDYYGIERLWGDAEVTDIEDTPDQ